MTQHRAKSIIFAAAAPLLGAALLLTGFACTDRPSVGIGVILPLTGDAQLYGESIQRGIELAYEDVTADPQFPFDLELTVEDSASDPERAASLLGNLLAAGSLAAIGGVTSDEALAMVPVTEKADRILISPSASSPKLSDMSKNFFRIFPTSKDEVVAMVNFAEENLNLEKMVVIMEQTAYGEGLATSMPEVFKGEIVGILAFTGKDGVQNVAQQAIDTGVNAIYLAADGEELGLLMRALRAGGFDGDNQWLLSSSALANPRVIEVAQGAAERSFLTQTVFNLESEEEPMATFVDDYQAKYGTMPDFFSAHGYDAMLVMAKALQEGGGTLPSDLVKGMRSIQDFTGVSGQIQFRESGDVQKFMRVFYISGGQLEDYVEYMEAKREEIRKKMEEIRRQRERLMRQSSG